MACQTRSADAGFEVGLDATHREPANDNRAPHGLTRESPVPGTVSDEGRPGSIGPASGGPQCGPPRPSGFLASEFRANVARDRRVRKELLDSGWRVAIVWECALRAGRANWTSLRLDHWLHGDERFFETNLDWDQQC